MTRFAALLLAALPAALLAPAAALAQPAAPSAVEEPQSDAFSQLYAAMESGIDQGQVLDNMVNATVLQMAQADPAIRDMEKSYPGVVRALVAGIRPHIAAYSERVRIETRPRMVAAIAEVMTVEEATALAAFYRSPMGQRLMQLATSNIAVSNVAGEFIDGEQVSAEAVARDLEETGRRGLAQMSPAEQAELVRVALATPGFDKLQLLQTRVAPIRAAMENAPPTAAEEAAIIGAVEVVIREFMR